MNLKLIFLGMAAFVFGVAMPFDTWFVDFTTWASYEVTLAQITLMGTGLVATLKGVAS